MCKCNGCSGSSSSGGGISGVIKWRWSADEGCSHPRRTVEVGTQEDSTHDDREKEHPPPLLPRHPKHLSDLPHRVPVPALHQLANSKLSHQKVWHVSRWRPHSTATGTMQGGAVATEGAVGAVVAVVAGDACTTWRSPDRCQGTWVNVDFEKLFAHAKSVTITQRRPTRPDRLTRRQR